MIHKRVLTLISTVFVGALTMTSLVGCSASNSATPGVVTIFNGATGTINQNFNPFSPTALQPTLGVIYESLYWYNLASDEPPTPMLATGYEWNAEGDELTIHTRPGVTWQDGEPFSAKDVAYTFELLRNTPALNTNGLAASAKAIDDNTVVLTFPEPHSFMQEPQILGAQAIVPEHIWKNIADPVAEINAHPIGTGAFALDTFTPQSYTLKRYEHYWNGAPDIDGVRYISLSDADAATSALLSGQVDWMSAYIPSLDYLIRNAGNLTYMNTPSLTTVIMACSNREAGCEGPQTDPAVREAMYWGMDRTAINNLAATGYSKTASPTLLLPERDERWISNPDYQVTPPRADVDKANQILDEAGWMLGPDGIRSKDGKSLTLTIQTVAGWSDFIMINDILRQQFKQIGINLETRQLAWNEWNEREQKGTYQLSLDSVGLGASDDPYFTYYPRLHSNNMTPVGETSSGQNYVRYSNPKVDEAIDNAARTNDEAERKHQYAVVQENLMKDLPYIPIFLNSMLTEFNAERFTNWPSEADPYALPASWKAWDQGIVLQHIKKKAQ